MSRRPLSRLAIEGGYRAVLADPPWSFQTFSGPKVPQRAAVDHYRTMPLDKIKALPVRDVAAANSVLFLWVTWPMLPAGLEVIRDWGFTYKTCGFCWVKGDALPLFPEDVRARMGMGYWTRSNSEVCLLATRGRPKRHNADVRQVIVETAREHSRKPDATHGLIERLVPGPYLELFARQRRPGWSAWGDETGKFK